MEASGVSPLGGLPEDAGGLSCRPIPLEVDSQVSPEGKRPLLAERKRANTP